MGSIAWTVLSDFVQHSPRWAFTLIVGLPLLVLVMTEVITRLRRRAHPLARGLALIRNLVIPSAALWIFLSQVAGHADDHLLVRLSQTLAWLTGLIAVLRIVNDLLFESDAVSATWRANVPSLFRDLVRVFLVAIGAAIIYSQVWGQSIEGAVTALGVTSIVIGLALQEPLSNIVSGVMLMFERPINLGDWVSADGVTGKVQEINWRSIHIAVPTQGLRIIPNSQLYKGSFNNLSRPDRIRTEAIELGFSYNDPPNKVKEMLLRLLRETPGVLDDPAPAVRTVNYADFAILYRVIFSVASSEQLPVVRDDFMSRIWYAIRREGISIPFPTQTEITQSQQEVDQASTPDPVALLSQFTPFKSVGEAPRDEQLEAGLRVRDFGTDELVVREGERIDGLHVVVRGEARLTVKDARGYPLEVARVGRGEFFGEGSVLAELPSEVTVTATSDLQLVVASPSAMYRLIGRSPALSRQLGHVMDSRRKAALSARRVASR
ncbi:MAG: mechanosensitive ion channel domain-containing protein [Planctomycetaceae bacterium]|jgi:small-conductance mechanosensitive channel